MHEREKVSLKEFPGRGDVGENSDGRPVLKFDGCLETLPVGLSEMPDSTALIWFSTNCQRDVHFDKDVVRRTDWSGGGTLLMFGLCCPKKKIGGSIQ